MSGNGVNSRKIYGEEIPKGFLFFWQNQQMSDEGHMVRWTKSKMSDKSRKHFAYSGDRSLFMGGGGELKILWRACQAHTALVNRSILARIFHFNSLSVCTRLAKALRKPCACHKCLV